MTSEIISQTPTPTTAEHWGFSFAAIFLISVLSTSTLLIFPLLLKKKHNNSLYFTILFLTSLGVGTLFSDAVLHLIPEGFEIGEAELTHEDLIIRSCLIIFGAYMLFIIDRLLHYFGHDHCHDHCQYEMGGNVESNDNSEISQALCENQFPCHQTISTSQDVSPGLNKMMDDLQKEMPDALARASRPPYVLDNSLNNISVSLDAENPYHDNLKPIQQQHHRLSRSGSGCMTECGSGTHTNSYHHNSHSHGIRDSHHHHGHNGHELERVKKTMYISPTNKDPSVAEKKTPTENDRDENALEICNQKQICEHKNRVHGDDDCHKCETGDNCNDTTNKKSVIAWYKKVKVAAWVVMLGDLVHNFIDGVIIGASFASSTNLGVSTSIAVLLHEIPHELGDFGIYVNGGFSFRAAVIANIVTDIPAFLGAIIGIALGQNYVSYISLLTAGMFLYLSLHSMMTLVIAQRQKYDGSNYLFGTFLVHLGLLFGFVMMLLMALYGENISV